MKTKTKLLFIACFLVAAIISTLALFYFYNNELRLRVLQPAIEAYYVGRYYLDFVPQIILWVLPPLIVALILIKRFIRWSREDQPPHAHQAQSVTPAEGELALLAHRIHRCQHSRFARVRLSRQLVEIGARMIAGKEGLSLWQARESLTGGYWRADDSVHRFLTPRRHYTSRQSGDEFRQSLREIVAHLEEFDHHG